MIFLPTEQKRRSTLLARLSVIACRLRSSLEGRLHVWGLLAWSKSAGYTVAGLHGSGRRLADHGAGLDGLPRLCGQGGSVGICLILLGVLDRIRVAIHASAKRH